MGLIERIKVQLKPSAEQTNAMSMDDEENRPENLEESDEKEEAVNVSTPEPSGVATIEAAQAIWGKKGRYLIIAG